jgi:beta-glucanase (GH16 family)
VPANSTLGRRSVRLESNAKFNSGLFIICLDHMPVGKGTWPAFWTFGPNWPNSGEIDIIEGIWTMNRNAVTLHTKQGCKMNETDQGTKFTGTWNVNKYNNDSATDCWINAPGKIF